MVRPMIRSAALAALVVVAVGFVISILQDSAETALNSSTDVVFTGAVAARSSPAS